MDASDNILSLDIVKEDMEKMEKLISDVTSKYTFCDRSMTVIASKSRDLLNKIQSDLEFKKETVLGLREKFVEIYEKVQDKVSKFDKDVTNFCDAGIDQNYFSQSFQDIPQEKIIFAKKARLKCDVDFLNYIFSIYQLIFPEIVIE